MGKMIGGVLISIVLLLVWYVHGVGFDAGVDNTVAKYSEVAKAAQDDFDKRLNQQFESYNQQIAEQQIAAKAEVARQIEQAYILAGQESKASTASIEIRERIKYVQSNCDDIGDDAFRLYQQTRHIVTDPRNTDPATSSAGQADTTGFTGSMLSRLATSAVYY